MFERNKTPHRARSARSPIFPPAFNLESLESRQLLSAAGTCVGNGGTSAAQLGNTIEFSQAPAAVQAGLEALAASDALTVPTASSTQTVYLSNTNGIESYTLDFTSTGKDTRITVDQTGAPVTAPTTGATTWATLNGTGAGSNAAAAAEISSIATALNLTAPASTTSIKTSTASNGTVTYTVTLAGATNSNRSRTFSVDSSGNPAGNENIPFSVIPTAIQTAINANLPAGATALSASSTQMVRVRTVDGVTTYSTTFITSGTTSKVTVTAAGTLASLPSNTTTTFSAIPTAAQTELQTLATADGVTATISQTQSVTAYSETNGVTVYSVYLTATNSSGDTYTITLSVDAAGNPTTPPNNGAGGFGSRFGGNFSPSIGGRFRY